ncbi:MAG: hypothetical protein Ct9H300mP1_15620 [Planctomycetaceae bacterium]|nr:MAG: hypothetical protein Ct9H300mP1_15620 [Planctomycetaceae bacterium]
MKAPNPPGGALFWGAGPGPATGDPAARRPGRGRGDPTAAVTITARARKVAAVRVPTPGRGFRLTCRLKTISSETRGFMIACTPPYKRFPRDFPPFDSTGFRAFRVVKPGRPPCDQSTDRSVRQNRFLVPHNLEFPTTGQFFLGPSTNAGFLRWLSGRSIARSECLMDEQATGNQGSGHQGGVGGGRGMGKTTTGS